MNICQLRVVKDKGARRINGSALSPQPSALSNPMANSDDCKPISLVIDAIAVATIDRIFRPAVLFHKLNDFPGHINARSGLNSL